MILQEAKNIAIEIWEKLKPHCDICKVAGSIRREKPEVKDIEICCLPKMIMGKDLFGGDTKKVRSQEFKNIVLGLGTVEKGKVDGKYMQIHLSEHGINLDLFMPDDFDYWRQLVIRTGSADWVAKYIAGGWKAIGWCGSDQGLRLQSQCEGKKGPDGKMKWRFSVAKKEAVLPPHWESEQAFFDWLHIKNIEPKYRNV